MTMTAKTISNGISKSHHGYFESVVSKDQGHHALLASVLEKRLPRSCFMYNQLKFQQDFNEPVSWYFYREKCNPNEKPQGVVDVEDSAIWIISKILREDWGAVISVSPPSSSFQTGVPVDVKFAMENSQILNWSKPYLFLCVDPHVSDFVMNLSVRKFGNTMKIYPSYMYCMEPKDAMNLDITPKDKSVEVRSLDVDKGTLFLSSLWTYTRVGSETYFRKCIEKAISGGVYVPSGNNGKEEEKELVCGGITPAYGIFSSLVTNPSHRRRGYAGLVTKYVYKEMARLGLYPCLDVEIGDPGAMAFHKTVQGNKIIGKVDYVCHKALM